MWSIMNLTVAPVGAPQCCRPCTWTSSLSDRACNYLYCSQQRHQQSSGSWVYACHSRHLFSLWERDCSALSARRRYHSVSTVNIRWPIAKMPAVISVALDWPVLQTNSAAAQSVPAVCEEIRQPST